jgi:NADP-dependent 3-hydroxy acid dehydrogenase YdfG
MGMVFLAVQYSPVAEAIAYAYQQPQHVCIGEIVLAATRQQP